MLTRTSERYGTFALLARNPATGKSSTTTFFAGLRLAARMSSRFAHAVDAGLADPA
jgi:hypothetical protein